MNFIQMPNDFQLNKLIFFKDYNYADNTKKLYWNLYLLYISDLELKYDRDLYNLSQQEIKYFIDSIKEKSKNTIDQTNSFINRYLEWYCTYYNAEEKSFKLYSKKQKVSDNLWYISKKDFFKICNKMLANNTLITNIIPLIFARYGILGREAIFMKNIKWNDIDYNNKVVLIRDIKSNIISNIPVDEDFFNWIYILKQYEKCLYKNKKVKNNFIIKSQIEKEEIINYASLNSKVYMDFKSINMKRIALTNLLNSAITDYLYGIYKNRKLKNNQELFQDILTFYPKENISLTKLNNIKKLYMDITKNENLNLIPTRKPYNKKRVKKHNNLEEISILKDEKINSKYSFRNAIAKDKDIFCIIVKKGDINKHIKVDEDIIDKIKKYKWYINLDNLVITRTKKQDRLEIVYLANFILGVNKYHKIGFKNDNKFDYRKENLIKL